MAVLVPPGAAGGSAAGDQHAVAEGGIGALAADRSLTPALHRNQIPDLTLSPTLAPSADSIAARGVRLREGLGLGIGLRARERGGTSNFDAMKVNHYEQVEQQPVEMEGSQGCSVRWLL